MFDTKLDDETPDAPAYSADILARYALRAVRSGQEELYVMGRLRVRRLPEGYKIGPLDHAALSLREAEQMIVNAIDKIVAAELAVMSAEEQD